MGKALRGERKHLPPFPKVKHITVTICNPLSAELRIVLGYFWETYIACIAWANNSYVTSEQRADYREQARLILEDVRNLCYELFQRGNAPTHIHSEFGCKDGACGAWLAGYEAGCEEEQPRREWDDC